MRGGHAMPPMMPQKKKLSLGNIIILLILLAVLGIIASFFLGDYTPVKSCVQKEDCGKYDVFYITGQGMVCANKIVDDGTIKNKMLLMRYAMKESINGTLSSCDCVESICTGS